MSDEKGYNGWTNYETWNLALWIGNEQGSESYWREMAEEAYRNAKAEKSFTRSERAALDLADTLKDEIESNTPTVTGFYADVLNAAISEVNWYEITTHWVDDIADEIEKEEESDEPDEDAITTHDHQIFYQYGKKYHTGDIESLKAQMDKDKLWPDVWFISDHGNAHRIDLNAKA